MSAVFRRSHYQILILMAPQRHHHPAVAAAAAAAGEGGNVGNRQLGDTTFTKIFVGGLAWETRRDQLRHHFETFGEILEAVVITDKFSGRSKGYGFVTFKDAESAARACVDPSPVIDRRRANCNLAYLGVRLRAQAGIPTQQALGRVIITPPIASAPLSCSNTSTAAAAAVTGLYYPPPPPGPFAFHPPFIAYTYAAATFPEESTCRHLMVSTPCMTVIGPHPSTIRTRGVVLKHNRYGAQPQLHLPNPYTTNTSHAADAAIHYPYHGHGGGAFGLHYHHLLHQQYQCLHHRAGLSPLPPPSFAAAAAATPRHIVATDSTTAAAAPPLRSRPVSTAQGRTSSHVLHYIR